MKTRFWVGIVVAVVVLAAILVAVFYRSPEEEAKPSGTIEIIITNTGQFTNSYLVYFNDRVAWAHYTCTLYLNVARDQGPIDKGSSLIIDPGDIVFVICEGLPFGSHRVKVEMNGEFVAERTLLVTEDLPLSILEVNVGR